VFTHIIGEIESIVSVLDSTKERDALKSQLSGFKSQITVLESHVKKKGGLQPSSEELEFNLTSLQRNVDLVARSLGIDPVWNNSKEGGDTHALTPRATSGSVSLQCWSFKQKAKKFLRVSASCKNIRAFSLRLVVLSKMFFKPVNSFKELQYV